MKVFKYSINEDPDFQYLVQSEIEEFFSEDFLKSRIHLVDEDNFYLVADSDDQTTIMNIIFNEDYKDLCEGGAGTVKDVTEDILDNISEYSNIPNLNSDENVLLTFYYDYIDKDIILDKISKKGVESLNDFDKEILSK